MVELNHSSVLIESREESVRKEPRRSPFPPQSMKIDHDKHCAHSQSVQVVADSEAKEDWVVDKCLVDMRRLVPVLGSESHKTVGEARLRKQSRCLRLTMALPLNYPPVILLIQLVSEVVIPSQSLEGMLDFE